VFLEIPADVFGVPYAMAEYMLRSLPNVDFPALRPYPDKEVLSQVAYAIGEAQSPVIVAGGGIHLGSAVQALQELARECGIPVATTLNGKGAINESSPLSLGVTGSKGNLEANKFVQDADCVIVIGSKLGDKSTNGYAWPTRDQMVIHVDSDPQEFHHVHAGYIPVLSDARALCQLLLPRLQGLQRQTTLLPPNKPFWEIGATDHLCNLLSQTLPQDAVVVADASVSSGWAGAAIRLHAPGQRLITPRGSGSIGFALPAAIGAQFARPSAQVVAIVGDGGFAMAMHEMETATRYNLPILYFLLNNQRLGLIDKHATALLGGAAVSENFFDIDWIQAGRAFGWTTIRIETAQQLSDAWPGLFPTRKPTLVDFRISAEEMAPDFFITLNKKRS
jgi:acetolactate synthase-1/2/3 large subunit